MGKMPCRAQREWRAFERAMARSKHTGRSGHPDMFVGRLVSGKPSVARVELGESTVVRIIPEQKL